MLSAECFDTWPYDRGNIWELIPPKELEHTQNDPPLNFVRQYTCTHAPYSSALP